MAGTLKFEAREVARVIAAAKKASQHRLSYEELHDPNMHLGGVIKLDADDEPDQANIDPAKVLPKLWLVKDYGVYLVSNGITPQGRRPALTYADGLSPKDDYFDLSNAIMGRADSIDALPLDDFENLLNEGASVIEINVTETSLEIFGTIPTKSRAPKK